MRRLLPFLVCLPLAAAGFFPVTVWYGGGKARAPMLEKNARAKKELWRKDIRQIKAGRRCGGWLPAPTCCAMG